MIQQPLQHGWKFYKSCSCGNMYQEWFTKFALTLKIFPNNNKFQVSQRGKQITSGTLDGLQTYLQEPVTT